MKQFLFLYMNFPNSLQSITGSLRMLSAFYLLFSKKKKKERVEKDEKEEVLGIDIDIHVDDKNDKNVESERNLGKMSLLSNARRKVLGFF